MKILEIYLRTALEGTGPLPEKRRPLLEEFCRLWSHESVKLGESERLHTGYLWGTVTVRFKWLQWFKKHGIPYEIQSITVPRSFLHNMLGPQHRLILKNIDKLNTLYVE